MKKAFGIPFMLLATFVILAHAFIPHHHHHRIAVSISDVSFIDTIFNHQHNHPHSHDHSHDHNPVNQGHEDEFSEDCLLDDLYRRLKQTRKFHLMDDDDSKPRNIINVQFFAADPVQTIEITDYGEFPFRQNHYLPASFLTHLGSSMGFRGPPEC